MLSLEHATRNKQMLIIEPNIEVVFQPDISPS